MKPSARAWAVLNILAFFGCGAGHHGSPAGRPVVPVSEPVGVANQEPESDAALIRPGQGVGRLRLGDTREKLAKVLGRKFEEYTHEAPCKYAEMHWYDLQADRNGIFAYVRDGRVFQLESDTPRYHTVEGTTSDAPPESVRSKYRNLQAYILLGSGSKVNGGRDLVYWVDRQSGITFEFYYNSNTRKRRVSRIIVFEPNSDFQPEGCVSAPQELRKLQSLSLLRANNDMVYRER